MVLFVDENGEKKTHQLQHGAVCILWVMDL
jgi:hypothetical protein